MFGSKNIFFGSETINVWQQLWYASFIQHIRTSIALWRRVWVFISSLCMLSGPDHFVVDWMMPNYSMQSHLSDEMGAAAYQLPTRWQDHARCTDVALAGLSVAGLQALVPRFHGGYVCMYFLKLKASIQSENSKYWKTVKSENWKLVKV